MAGLIPRAGVQRVACPRSARRRAQVRRGHRAAAAAELPELRPLPRAGAGPGQGLPAGRPRRGAVGAGPRAPRVLGAAAAGPAPRARPQPPLVLLNYHCAGAARAGARRPAPPAWPVAPARPRRWARREPGPPGPVGPAAAPPLRRAAATLPGRLGHHQLTAGDPPGRPRGEASRPPGSLKPHCPRAELCMHGLNCSIQRRLFY